MTSDDFTVANDATFFFSDSQFEDILVAAHPTPRFCPLLSTIVGQSSASMNALPTVLAEAV